MRMWIKFIAFTAVVVSRQQHYSISIGESDSVSFAICSEMFISKDCKVLKLIHIIL
jgi:hypothetical protein